MRLQKIQKFLEEMSENPLPTTFSSNGSYYIKRLLLQWMAPLGSASGEAVKKSTPKVIPARGKKRTNIMMILQFLLKYFMFHFCLPNFLKNAVIKGKAFSFIMDLKTSLNL